MTETNLLGSATINEHYGLFQYCITSSSTSSASTCQKLSDKCNTLSNTVGKGQKASDRSYCAMRVATKAMVILAIITSGVSVLFVIASAVTDGRVLAKLHMAFSTLAGVCGIIAFALFIGIEQDQAASTFTDYYGNSETILYSFDYSFGLDIAASIIALIAGGYGGLERRSTNGNNNEMR